MCCMFHFHLNSFIMKATKQQTFKMPETETKRKQASSKTELSSSCIYEMFNERDKSPSEVNDHIIYHPNRDTLVLLITKLYFLASQAMRLPQQESLFLSPSFSSLDTPPSSEYHPCFIVSLPMSPKYFHDLFSPLWFPCSYPSAAIAICAMYLYTIHHLLRFLICQFSL